MTAKDRTFRDTYLGNPYKDYEKWRSDMILYVNTTKEEFPWIKKEINTYINRHKCLIRKIDSRFGG